MRLRVRVRVVKVRVKERLTARDRGDFGMRGGRGESRHTDCGTCRKEN